MKKAIIIAALVAAAIIIVTIARGNAAEPTEVQAETPEAVAVETTEAPLPDPCGLEVVYCEGEDGYLEKEMQNIIFQAAIDADIDPQTAIRIAKCESTMNPYAMNPDTGAKGLFQFLDSTWAWIEAEGSPYNPYDAARAFAEWYPKHPEWWVCK
jgi:soluble lytic murein transglycosylase-like protein